MNLIRVLAAATAVVTAVLMLIGGHPPEFLVADAVVVVMLGVAALLRSPTASAATALSGFGFAGGVFLVAFAGSVADGAANYRVGVAVPVALLGAVLTARRLRRLAGAPGPVAA